MIRDATAIVQNTGMRIFRRSAEFRFFQVILVILEIDANPLREISVLWGGGYPNPENCTCTGLPQGGFRFSDFFSISHSHA